MNILVISDMAQTGFGRVGRELATGFIAAGHSVRILAINWRGRAGEIAALLENEASSSAIKARLDEIDADPLFPFMHMAQLPGDGLGTQLTGPAAKGIIWKGWTADRIITVADPRAFLMRVARDNGVMREIRSYNYTPIEGGELPAFDAEMWRHVTPVAMSRFGKAELDKLLGVSVPYIPHGVSERFFPVSPERPGRYDGQDITSKEEAKAALGWEGRTVLLRTDRFVVRKNYPALFATVGPLLSEFPELLLVIHCAAQDEGGLLPEILSKVPGAFQVDGKWQHPQIKLTQAHDTFRGLSDDEMNTLYNAADVYVSPTMSEGFGLTMAEAAQCSIPVVTTDYAAGPEVLGKGALLARVAYRWVNNYGIEWALVDEEDFRDKLYELLDRPELREEVGAAGAEHIKQFTWERTVEGFLKLLA
jgi:glycosyltransferase involved in cell wall biosynthesis